MRLRAAALPPVLLAVVLMAPGGCGTTGKSDTSKFSGTDKAVAQSVYDLRDAIAQRDEGKICDTYLTTALKNQLGNLAKQDKRGVTCADELKTSIQDVDSTDITVTAVSITGNTATATITTKVQKGPPPTDTLTLVNQHGWRLSKLP
jgi:hypothetical protein